MDFYLKIAGLSFLVIGWKQSFPGHFADYRCEAVADAIPIVITEQGRARERAEASATGGTISDFSCDFLCVMRQMAQAALLRQRMFIHGACISFRGHGFLFTAPSGTGKTTHIRLWRDFLGDEVRIINGDKTVLTFDNDITVSGSPWAGKEGYQENLTVPLHAVILLKRGQQNAMRPVTPKEALCFLYGQIFLIDAPESAADILKYLDQLLRKVPLYELQCTMEEDALHCSFETLTGLEYPMHEKN